MARDQQPVTDAEIEAAREAMKRQREEIRDYLASELGGEAEEYRAEIYLGDAADEIHPDGGQETN